MRLQDDQNENEQQPVDDGVDEHGRQAGLHVHEVHRPLPAGHLQDAAGAQERVQRCGDDRRRPVDHLAVLRRESPLLNNRQRRAAQRRSRAQDYGKFRHTFYNCGSLRRQGASGDMEKYAMLIQRIRKVGGNENEQGIGRRAHYHRPRGDHWAD
jgi:hypothetical protein